MRPIDRRHGQGSSPRPAQRDGHTGTGLFVDEYTMYQQWLMGFVTGFKIKHASEAEQQQQVRIDPAAMDLWMRNWCNQYPTQKVYQAANAFIDEVRINAATGRR